MVSQALHRQHDAERAAARLPPLLVAAERVANTVAQGIHGRRRVGIGESFWQFRRYEPGDSLQRIDWRQSAKNDPVFVRENEWEAAQTVYLWRDMSPSMNWHAARTRPTKHQRADLMLLATAVLLVRGGERVASFEQAEPPSGSRITLNRMALRLTQEADRTDTASLPPKRILPRHAQVVLFSDFLSPLEETHTALQQLTGAGIRGHLVHIMDPAEESLPFDGRVEFRGLEGEGRLLIPRVEGIRDAYREKLAAHRDGLAAMARTAGWSLITHHTDRPPHVPLLALHAAIAQMKR
jgi:uncharacterized protein (DUF58 family)